MQQVVKFEFPAIFQVCLQTNYQLPTRPKRAQNSKWKKMTRFVEFFSKLLLSKIGENLTLWAEAVEAVAEAVTHNASGWQVHQRGQRDEAKAFQR